MKISKITIDNIRCFEHLEIDLNSKNGASNLVLIVGNNGVGKTTVLRSIALGICEQSGASGLIDELEGNWIRDGKKDATIKIEIEPFKGCTEKAHILTTFKQTEIEEIEVKQHVSPEKPETFKWKELFLCGYGAGRRQYGAQAYSEYTITDAVYTLFNYDHDLQNPELNIRRASSVGIKERTILEGIEKILMLEENSITLDMTGIRVSGPWGSKMPMGALGDGYQATMAWILDWYGWYLLLNNGTGNRELSGIILLDELEQHLHPILQMEIIKRFNNQYKSIQFITTTHSPLIALNSHTLEDEKQRTRHFVLDWSGDYVEISQFNELLFDLDYDQLLASEAFGHIYNTNTEIDKILREMSKLASIDKPNKSQSVKLEKIKQELKQIMFPEGRTLIERIVERDYYKELEKENKKFKEILEKKANK